MIGIEVYLKLLLATILGGIVGIEREFAHKPAGLRTHMLVALASCMFMVLSTQFTQSYADSSRIAAGVVSGIGFIGAGTIIAGGRKRVVIGITTAASIWVTAAIGMAVGFGLYPEAIFTTILATLILWSRKALPIEKEK